MTIDELIDEIYKQKELLNEEWERPFMANITKTLAKGRPLSDSQDRELRKLHRQITGRSSQTDYQKYEW